MLVLTKKYPNLWRNFVSDHLSSLCRWTMPENEWMNVCFPASLCSS